MEKMFVRGVRLVFVLGVGSGRNSLRATVNWTGSATLSFSPLVPHCAREGPLFFVHTVSAFAERRIVNSAVQSTLHLD